jgi:IPT/TIG domain/Family of unknown function (DUF5719)
MGNSLARTLIFTLITLIVAVSICAAVPADEACAAPASISGTVRRANGNSPVDHCMVVAIDTTTLNQVGDAQYTASDGTYSYPGLTSGSYYKMLFIDETGTLACEWYNNATLYSAATPVMAPQTGISASLEPGVTVSGSVTEEGSGVPMTGCYVDLYDSSDWVWIMGVRTDSSGHYLIKGVHPGTTYKLYFYPDDSYHKIEWYNNATTWYNANPVASGSTGVNVQLALKTPHLTAVSPTSGSFGADVTLSGSAFGSGRGGSIVYFGGTPATDYISWNNSQIRVIVPFHQPGACNVQVVTPGGTSETQSFTVLAAAWYLAEGTSDWGFDTYVTIENPNDKPVTARITYMTKNGPKQRPDLRLPAGSQTTVNPREDLGATDFSTRVECLEGKWIVVDRRMIWLGRNAPCTEGHASVGVTAPSTTWYLAEGSSKWGFETWLLIQNPNGADANVTITYMIEGENPVQVNKKVSARSRASFDMAGDIGAKDASIKVDSDLPVIPERAMYRNDRREGHDSIGTMVPSTDYYLAEGTTDYGFTTYVLVQNPGDQTAKVTLTYMTAEGPQAQPQFEMPARSRKTIRVNDALPSKDLSTWVHGSVPVIAERAMYWDRGLGEACHDSIGLSSPHADFYMPDGETYNGCETWTLVQNPNGSDVQIEVSYLTPTGQGNVVFADTVKANSRKTYNMASRIPAGKAAIKVSCKTTGKKIICERAMYWNSRGAGTDTIGGYSD